MKVIIQTSVQMVAGVSSGRVAFSLAKRETLHLCFKKGKTSKVGKKWAVVFGRFLTNVFEGKENTKVAWCPQKANWLVALS